MSYSLTKDVLTGVRDIIAPKGIVVFTVEALDQPTDIPTPAPIPVPVPATVTATVTVAATETSVSPSSLSSLSSSLSYALQPSGRIAHSHEYITRVIQEV